MSQNNVSNRAADRAAHDLRSSMPGQVLLPADHRYEAARSVWNSAIDHRPALIARCETATDVQAAVRAARTHGLALAVRGGGHDWAGRSVCHGGLMIENHLWPSGRAAAGHRFPVARNRVGHRFVRKAVGHKA